MAEKVGDKKCSLKQL